LDGGIALVAIEMESTAAGDIERGHRVQVMVIAAAQDCALAVGWHHER
jgi:hypothetical protein